MLAFLKPFASLRRVNQGPALAWKGGRRSPQLWWPDDPERVEEIVEGCSASELFDWERQIGLMTFEPPVDYSPADVSPGRS
jgi:hypothetical protein